MSRKKSTIRNHQTKNTVVAEPVETVRRIDSAFLYSGDLSEELVAWLKKHSECAYSLDSTHDDVYILHRSTIAHASRTDPFLEDKMDLFYEIVHLHDALYKYDVILMSRTLIVFQ